MNLIILIFFPETYRRSYQHVYENLLNHFSVISSVINYFYDKASLPLITIPALIRAIKSD